MFEMIQVFWDVTLCRANPTVNKNSPTYVVSHPKRSES